MPNLNKELHINQVFKSIQGEGPKIGTPSLFIRMQYCNLCCGWCDTKYALGDDDHIIIKDDDEEFDEFMSNMDIESDGLYNLVLTGGEPLLYAKNPMFLDIINSGIWNTIEIETNGMLITEQNMDNIHKYSSEYSVTLNISPKLDVACYKTETDIDYIINRYKSKCKLLQKHKLHIDHMWKFVYDIRNASHIQAFIEMIGSKNRVWAMPWTPERSKADFKNEFRYSCQRTLEFCMETGIRYSPREHVWIFGANQIDEVEKVI